MMWGRKSVLQYRACINSFHSFWGQIKRDAEFVVGQVCGLLGELQLQPKAPKETLQIQCKITNKWRTATPKRCWIRCLRQIQLACLDQSGYLQIWGCPLSVPLWWPRPTPPINTGSYFGRRHPMPHLHRNQTLRGQYHLKFDWKTFFCFLYLFELF